MSGVIGMKMVPSITRLGKFIRRIRLKKKISQVDLALRSDNSQQFVSKLENRRLHHINEAKLARVATVLECSPDELRKRLPKAKLKKLKSKFGKFIRARRLFLGLSYEEFAARLSMKLPEARAIENDGRKSVGIQRVEILAKALELEIKDLMIFVDEKVTSDPLGNLIRSKRQEKFMRLEDLALAIGVKKQFMFQIESGICSLVKSPEHVSKLCEVLSINAVEFEALQSKRKLKEPEKKICGFAKFVADRRIELSLTKEELARKMGRKTASLIGKIEKDDHIPRIASIRKIEAVLECTIPQELYTS